MKCGNIVKTIPGIVITMMPLMFTNNILTMFYDVPVTFFYDFVKHFKCDIG